MKRYLRFVDYDQTSRLRWTCLCRRRWLNRRQIATARRKSLFPHSNSYRSRYRPCNRQIGRKHWSDTREEKADSNNRNSWLGLVYRKVRINEVDGKSQNVKASHRQSRHPLLQKRPICSFWQVGKRLH